MKHVIVILNVALALTAFATAIHAQDNNDPPSVRVSYADLDLSNQSGWAMLNSRVKHAVDVVCGERPSLLDLKQTAAYARCRSTARISADKQLAQLQRGEVLADQTSRVNTRR
ncbi:MAG TPA: UrcA family protein [Caulobacteraceae bacterium]|jgi:UrcA family protein